jgi:hypothetical protein
VALPTAPVSEKRGNRRNGYRAREFDTRAGTIELAIPKLRQGTYFPEWLLEHRKRAERALTSVVATATCLACPPAGWTSGTTLATAARTSSARAMRASSFIPSP